MTTRVPLNITTDMVRALAVNESVCVRPLLRRVTDRATGNSTTVAIACGSTRESRCPTCAKKARWLRMTQCAEGWHRDDEPEEPDLEETEHDNEEQLEDDDIDDDAGEEQRRVRSTRHRQDVSDLPRVPIQNHTIGRTFTAPSGVTYRPSMFVTLTLPSYGKVIPGRGVPVHPGRYDYRRAALDALHFPKLVDRWVQNLRRGAGYKVQHFSAVEPQRRLAPHLHTALRGAIPRQIVKAVTKGTYLHLWWPSFEDAVYVDRLPLWDRENQCHRDPDTGLPLTTWHQALDELDADQNAAPVHAMRFGSQVDIKGIDGGSPDADRAVRYLTKYLTKAVTETYTDPDGEHIDPAYEAHIDRMHDELQFLPCSPDCANWLRYGVQPKNPGPGLVPGYCASKAHDREHLGLGGRRVLVSRKWSGKTLTQHRADRAAVVRQVLQAAGVEAPEADRLSVDVLHEDGQPRFVWDDIPVTGADYTEVLVASVMERRRWRAQYDTAKQAALERDRPPVDNRSATTNDTAHDAA